MDRQTLILTKNLAYDALWKAERYIDRRRNSHLHGYADPVPAAWLERREQLAADYNQALAAVNEAKDWRL